MTIQDSMRGPGSSKGHIAILGKAINYMVDKVGEFHSAGTTEFMASILPVGEDAERFIARTKSLLRSLVEKH